MRRRAVQLLAGPMWALLAGSNRARRGVDHYMWWHCDTPSTICSARNCLRVYGEFSGNGAKMPRQCHVKDPDVPPAIHGIVVWGRVVMAFAQEQVTACVPASSLGAIDTQQGERVAAESRHYPSDGFWAPTVSVPGRSMRTLTPGRRGLEVVLGARLTAAPGR